MKKSLLGIGTIAAIAGPLAGAVSCTLIKKDKMEDFIDYKKFRSIDEILSTFDKDRGANIGISPWLSSFWKQRSNKLLGALNYKTNNNGIIASNGFDLEDVRALSRLFEAQTWLEYGGYDAKSIDGLAPTSTDVNKYDIRLDPATGAGRNISTVSDLNLLTNSWLSSFNINYGKSYKENDKIEAFVNGELQEFNAWNTNSTEGTFIHSNDPTNKETTNIFELESGTHLVTGDGYDHSKTELEEIKNQYDKKGDVTNLDLRRFVNTQIDRLISQTRHDRYHFVPKLMGTKINFYIAYNIHANMDANQYNDSDVTLQDDSQFSDLKSKVESWFKRYGIDINLIKVPLGGEGDDAKSNVVVTSADTKDSSKWGKPFDADMLTEIANSNKKALVYMPVDSWLSAGKPKGSLLLQKRNIKTIGDDVFYSEDEPKDPIKVDEPKLVEQMDEIYSSFSTFANGDNLSLLDFYDFVTKATTYDHLADRNELVQANKDLLAVKAKLKTEAETFLKANLASLSANEVATLNDDKTADEDIIQLARKHNFVETTALALEMANAEKVVAQKNSEWLAKQQETEDWKNQQSEIARNAYMSKWFDDGKKLNVFSDKSNAFRDAMKVLPIIDEESKNINYRVNEYFTVYNTQYIFSPDIRLKHDTQRYFSQTLDAASPKASNNYIWSINARNNLPLPVTVGYTDDNDGAMRPNISSWISKHFMI